MQHHLPYWTTSLPLSPQEEHTRNSIQRRYFLRKGCIVESHIREVFGIQIHIPAHRRYPHWVKKRVMGESLGSRFKQQCLDKFTS